MKWSSTHLHEVDSVCYLGGHITVQCDDTYTGYINPINQINKPDVHKSKTRLQNNLLSIFY